MKYTYVKCGWTQGLLFGSIPVDWKEEFLGVDIPEGEPPVIGGERRKICNGFEFTCLEPPNKQPELPPKSNNGSHEYQTFYWAVKPCFELTNSPL